MKWLGMIAACLLLAAGGFAVWFFVFREGEMPELFSPPYPRESASLTEAVEIHEKARKVTTISAYSRTDLLYAQGLHHGRLGGKRLESLRDLFRGKPGAGPDSEMARLAELFYFLEHVAHESWPLYPVAVQVLIEAYARGLSESRETETTWSARDVLLMQRGYAFLGGRNLAKSWTAEHLHRRVGNEASPLLGFTCGEPAGLARETQLAATLEPLFRPFLETIYLRDEAKVTGILTRTRPSLAFIQVPMVLEVKGLFVVEGVSLLGLPFLQSGRNGTVSWHPQTVLADDEQIVVLPRTAFLGRADLLRAREDATHYTEYGAPPVHARPGRLLRRLISGADDTDTWLYWDGFRPSADLVAQHEMLAARDIDAAITAFQYHQVPPVELFLEHVSGQTARVACLPSDPTVPLADRGLDLFKGPRIGYLPATAVRGVAFSRDRSVSLTSKGFWEAPRSAVDEELFALIRFFLRDERYLGIIGEEKWRHLDSLIRGPRGPQRDYLIQQVWAGLSDWLVREGADPLGLDLALKRYLLTSLARRSGSERGVAMPQTSRGRVIAEILATIDTREPVYAMAPDGRKNRLSGLAGVGSSDAVGGTCAIARYGQVALVATYLMTWEDNPRIWQYPFSENKRLGEPRLLDPRFRSPSPYTIAPAL